MAAASVAQQNEEQIVAEKELDKVIAQYLAAVNRFDTDGIVASFAEDAFVNDASLEFRVSMPSALGSSERSSETR